jgi:hypothetical protein
MRAHRRKSDLNCAIYYSLRRNPSRDRKTRNEQRAKYDRKFAGHCTIKNEIDGTVQKGEQFEKIAKWVVNPVGEFVAPNADEKTQNPLGQFDDDQKQNRN